MRLTEGLLDVLEPVVQLGELVLAGLDRQLHAPVSFKGVAAWPRPDCLQRGVHRLGGPLPRLLGYRRHLRELVIQPGGASGQALNFDVDVVDCEWGAGIDMGILRAKLQADVGHEIKAVCVVHNETATGVTNDLAAVRSLLGEQESPNSDTI